MFVYDLAPWSLKLIYAIVLVTVRPRRRGREVAENRDPACGQGRKPQ
jgi:hypothetical protein